jgi:PAS domain S-box-containing protein
MGSRANVHTVAAYAALTPDAQQQLLHELQVHQIELELQNEELRRTQTALDTAQARYFDFYDMAPVGYVTVSDKALILQANLTTAALLGMPRSKLIGKPLPGFMPVSDADRYYLLCQQAQDSGSAQSCELQMYLANGNGVWVKLQAIAAIGEDGSTVIRLVLSDITERKQAEALRLANNTFRDAILDSVPSQIAVLDHTGTIVAVNQTWRAFALANSAVPGEPARHTQIGTNYLDICSSAQGGATDDSAALTRDGILRVIRGTAPSFEFEYPCHSPTQQRWFSLAVTPLKLGDHAVVVTHTDITQRRQLEQAAKEASENKFRLVADNTSDGILIFGANRQIQYVSPAYVNQLGYSEAEELNRSPDQIFALIHPQDRDAVLCGIERAIASKQSDLLYAYRIQHRLGHTIWREDHARFQYDGCGNYAGACVVARDITERMHAKADLLETNRVLIQTRLQLRELLAQNEATLENEKRHIAREVHDELGQVLTALRMDLALAVIRHAAQAPDLLDELNGMKNQVDRAIQGVRSVANSLRPAALDMGLVTAIEWLCMEFTKYGDVECGLHGFDESFEIDDSRAVVIFRIVQEALTNIRKYAQACEVKVTLEMRGPELGVEVRDNGLGFDLAAVAQRGTLGLLGMRERVIALGGRIEVHSTPGQGTTISVVIPLEPKVANVAKGPA